jgi:hypothetical protein
VEIQYRRVAITRRDRIDDDHGVLLSGPFHTALRWAIAARGLSLDRIGERLAGAGYPVSVSTLSNWQRGVGRPRRSAGPQAVAALEAVLDLPSGALQRLLAEPAHRGRRQPLIPGTPRSALARLREELEPPGEPGVAVLAVQDDLTVTPDGWQAVVRLVVQARRPGVDRYVVHCHASSGAPPELGAGRDARLGRSRTDPVARLAAAELLFAPLGHGETLALDYRVAATAYESYYGRWVEAAGRRLELTVRFAPGLGVGRAHRIWRLDPGSAHRDVAPLRLIDGRLVHLLDEDATPGFHGIRWAR